MRVVVLLKDAEGERFEAFCRERGHKKSTLIVRLIREHLDRERYAAQPELFHAGDRPDPAAKEKRSTIGSTEKRSK